MLIPTWWQLMLSAYAEEVSVTPALDGDHSFSISCDGKVLLGNGTLQGYGSPDQA